MEKIIESNDTESFKKAIDKTRLHDLHHIITSDRHECLKIYLDVKGLEEADRVYGSEGFYDDGWTLLHSAGTYEAVNCTRLLLDYGADPKKEALASALTCIDCTLNLLCFALMLEKCNSDFINKENKERGTLLQRLIKRGKKEHAELLIDKGAKLDDNSDDRPAWFIDILSKRQNTRRASQVVIMMLKTQRIVCKDLALMIGKAVWETRWLNPVEEFSPKRKNRKENIYPTH